MIIVYLSIIYTLIFKICFIFFSCQEKEIVIRISNCSIL